MGKVQRFPEVSFKNPVKIGDTVHVEYMVKKLIEEDSKNESVVLFDCDVVNQNDVVVQYLVFRGLLCKNIT